MANVLDQFAWKDSAARRRMASEKLHLFEGDREHVNRLHQIIGERITSAKIADRVKKWANASRNLCRQITKTVATGYSRGCVRELINVPEQTAAAFADIVAESGIQLSAPRINAYAWLLGPTMVVPVIEGDGTFWLDIVGPHRCDAMRQNPRRLSALLYQHKESGAYIRLDTDAWSYYDKDGEPLKGKAPIVHGLGYAPAAIFRSEDFTESWWNESEHRALVDASYNVALYAAIMAYGRRQSGKVLVVKAPKDALPEGQPVENPGVLYIDMSAANGAPADVTAVDLDSPVQTWLNLMDAETASVCNLYGLPPSLITGVNSNTDWGQVGMARAPEVLDKLRDDQIAGLIMGERQLWPMVCDVLRASTHRHASALPPGDEVAEMLRVKFHDGLFNLKRAKDRIDVFKEQEALGLASVPDLLMEENPALTAEQAEEIIERNLARYFARIERSKAHNLSTDPAEAAASVAQLQGKLGGMTKAANAAAQVNDNE